MCLNCNMVLLCVFVWLVVVIVVVHSIKHAVDCCVLC